LLTSVVSLIITFFTNESNCTHPCVCFN